MHACGIQAKVVADDVSFKKPQGFVQLSPPAGVGTLKSINYLSKNFAPRENKVGLRAVDGINLIKTMFVLRAVFNNNNNNVHLSCAHQRPEFLHDTY